MRVWDPRSGFGGMAVLDRRQLANKATEGWKWARNGSCLELVEVHSILLLNAVHESGDD